MPPRYKYAHVRYRALSWNPNEYAHPALGNPDEVFHPRVTTEWRRQAGRFPNQPKQKLARPDPARDTDPLTIMLLLDGLLRTNPDAYINAGNLSMHLATDEAQYSQILWNPTVVGRLLSNIHVVAQEVAPPNGGAPLIDRSTYGGQKNYVIQPDIHTWHWLGCLREYYGQLTKQTIAEELLNQAPKILTNDDIWAHFHFEYGEAPKP